MSEFALDQRVLHNLLSYSSEAIIFSDLEGTVQFSNAAADALYGYEKGELQGQNVDIFNSHQTHNTDDIVEAIKTNGQWKGELIQRRKDNSNFWSALTVALIFDDTGQPIGLGSHSRDISQEKAAAEELRESEEKYRKLFETTQDGIIVHVQGKILDLNQRIADIFGYGISEMWQKQISDLIHPDDLEKAMTNMQVGYELPYQHRALHKDGSILYLEIVGRPIQFSGTEARVIVVHDITQQTQNEKTIKAALKEKEVLLGEIYHRTKNNMQVISSLLSLQAMQLNNDAVKTAFQDLKNKIQSMALVHQKLYESKSLSTINLDEYIQDLAALLHQTFETAEKKISLHFELENIQVLIDSAMACGLIISELLSNSYKHAFANQQEGKINIRLQKQVGNQVELVIADNGTGIENGFDFRSQKTLGLTTIHGIVEQQLRGTVEFKTNGGLNCLISFKDDFYQSRI